MQVQKVQADLEVAMDTCPSMFAIKSLIIVARLKIKIENKNRCCTFGDNM